LAERSLFDYRYAIPGYTFLLVIIAANVDLLGFAKLGGNTGLSLLAGFLVAFSGSPLGFLISQPWFLYFRKFVLPNAPYILLVQDKLPELKCHPAESSIVADYIFLSSTEQSLKDHAQRRFDLVNSFGATGTGILAGILGAFVFRYSASYFLSFDFLKYLTQNSVGEWNFWFVLLASGVAIVLLSVSYRSMKPEHDKIARQIILTTLGNDLTRWHEVANNVLKQ
jgi:hypothetical protein